MAGAGETENLPAHVMELDAVGNFDADVAVVAVPVAAVAAAEAADNLVAADGLHSDPS